MRTCVLTLACLLSVSCATVGLSAQIQLRSKADTARVECITSGKSCPDMVKDMSVACVKARAICSSAQHCVKSIQTAVAALQSLQVARSTGQDTADLTVQAVGSEAAARAICVSSGGW